MPGLEHADIETDLPELPGALEERELAERAVIAPARVLRAQDEPALTGGDDPYAGVLERSFGHHRP